MAHATTASNYVGRITLEGRVATFLESLRPLKSAQVNPAIHSRWRRTSMFLGSLWDLGAYVYLFFAGLVEASRTLGPNVVVFLHPAHAVLPWIVAPSLLVAAVAVLRRRLLPLLLGTAVAISGWFAVSPARGVTPRPVWVGSADFLTIVSANLKFDNKTPAQVAPAIAARNAEVVVIEELTDAFVLEFERAGFVNNYPFRSLVPRPGGIGAGIYSKYPFANVRRTGSTKLPEVDVSLPSGQTARVLVMHPLPPLSDADADAWTNELSRLGARATKETKDPFVAIGDFNATRWQPAFGRLLHVYTDVHEAVGKGLSMSWPQGAGIPPIVRLDHALVNDMAFPVAVDDFVVPGSDHRGFAVKLALRKPPQETLTRTGAQP
jgi:endonuclease/exonuclease/phosphatase (EEP) superfamily protein YafD